MAPPRREGMNRCENDGDLRWPREPFTLLPRVKFAERSALQFNGRRVPIASAQPPRRFYGDLLDNGRRFFSRIRLRRLGFTRKPTRNARSPIARPMKIARRRRSISLHDTDRRVLHVARHLSKLLMRLSNHWFVAKRALSAAVPGAFSEGFRLRNPSSRAALVQLVVDGELEFRVDHRSNLAIPGKPEREREREGKTKRTLSRS